MRNSASMKTIHALLLAGLIFSLNSAATFAQKRNIQISGRAVDEKGKGIQGALVTIYYPPCKNCFEHLLHSFETLPEGGFVLEAPWVPERKLTLFIEEPTPNGFWAPYKPFIGNLSNGKGYKYKGTIVALSRKSRIDVGDVRVNVRYGRVSLRFTNCEPEWRGSSNIDVTVKNHAGVIVQQISVPKAAIDLKASLVKLAIPAGKWELIFSMRNPGGKIERKVYVHVTPSASLTLDLCGTTQNRSLANYLPNL
jgi:hypothetical protein